MTTALDQFDTVNDLITQTIAALNDSTVDQPKLSPVQQVLADRIRELVTANLNVTRLLLHDHAETIGLFDRVRVPS